MQKTCKDCGCSSENNRWVMLHGELYRNYCADCNSKRQTIKRNKPENKEKAAIKRRATYNTTEGKQKALGAQQKYRATDKGKETNKLASARHFTNKLQTDPLARFQHGVRTLVNATFRLQAYRKNSRTHEILGASYSAVLQHLLLPLNLPVSQGIPTGYEIDHIIPVTLAYDEASMLWLSRYTNLQLLPAADNIKKSDWINGVRARTLTGVEKKSLLAKLGYNPPDPEPEEGEVE